MSTNTSTSDPSDESDKTARQQKLNNGIGSSGRSPEATLFYFLPIWRGSLAGINLEGPIGPGRYKADISRPGERVSISMLIGECCECSTMICFRRKHDGADWSTIWCNKLSLFGYRGVVERLMDDIQYAVESLDIPGAEISDELRADLVRTVRHLSSWETQKVRRIPR